MADNDDLMPPGDVARMFRVTVKTVGRWVDSGLLTDIRTAGGHRRILQREAEALYESRKRKEQTSK